MKKYTTQDLKRIGYGYMIQELFIEQGLTLEEFCKTESGKYWISPSTAKQYIRSGGGTLKSRVMAAQGLGYTEKEINVLVKGKLIKIINDILENLHEYRKDKNFLLTLKKLINDYDLNDYVLNIIKEDIKNKLKSIRGNIKKYDNNYVINILEKAIDELNKSSTLDNVEKLLVDIIFEMNNNINNIHYISINTLIELKDILMLTNDE